MNADKYSLGYPKQRSQKECIGRLAHANVPNSLIVTLFESIRSVEQCDALDQVAEQVHELPRGVLDEQFSGDCPFKV